MKIFPAIDLLDGCAVRLTRGDYDQKTVYSSDPVSVAAFFASCGASSLHLVDLDGARDGGVPNADTVRRILEATSLFVEIGGGIRTPDRIEAYLSAGASRVILGTAALRNPAFRREAVRRYGDAVAVGVDAKDGKVAVAGWREVSDVDSFDFCRTLAEEGVSTVIYTDVACDGAMKGTNLPAFRRLKTIEGLGIVASGGICTHDDLTALREMDVEGAIVGKALYTGALSLADILRYEKEVL